MQFLRIFAVAAVSLSLAASASAQGILSPILSAISVPGLTVTNTAIGPDGTFYAVVPGTGSTAFMPASELVAVGVAASPATKWTANLTGQLGSILPGANTVFILQTVFTGSGRMTTSTASILTFSAATGAAGTTIAPTGNISDIQVRTIGNSDYLYVYTTSTTSSGTNPGITTFTFTRTLTIYSQSGTVIKTVTL